MRDSSRQIFMGGTFMRGEREENAAGVRNSTGSCAQTNTRQDILLTSVGHSVTRLTLTVVTRAF